MDSKWKFGFPTEPGVYLWVTYYQCDCCIDDIDIIIVKKEGVISEFSQKKFEKNRNGYYLPIQLPMGKSMLEDMEYSSFEENVRYCYDEL